MVWFGQKTLRLSRVENVMWIRRCIMIHQRLPFPPGSDDAGSLVPKSTGTSDATGRAEGCCFLLRAIPGYEAGTRPIRSGGLVWYPTRHAEPDKWQDKGVRCHCDAVGWVGESDCSQTHLDETGVSDPQC